MEVYVEIGLGNDTFFSTEYEGDNKEYRVPRFELPQKIRSVYLRVWLFKKVYIFSTNDGFETTQKQRNKFKILFGIAGTNVDF